MMQQSLLNQGAFLHAMRIGIPLDLLFGCFRDMRGDLSIYHARTPFLQKCREFAARWQASAFQEIDQVAGTLAAA